MKDVMVDLMKDAELQKKAKNLAAFVSKLIPEINASPKDQKQRKLKAEAIDEKGVIEEAKALLAKEFQAQISVYDEEDPKKYDPKARASTSKPYRPAIYIE